MDIKKVEEWSSLVGHRARLGNSNEEWTIVESFCCEVRTDESIVEIPTLVLAKQQSRKANKRNRRIIAFDSREIDAIKEKNEGVRLFYRENKNILILFKDSEQQIAFAE